MDRDVKSRDKICLNMSAAEKDKITQYTMLGRRRRGIHHHPLEFRFGNLIPFWRSSGYGMHIAAASAKQAGPLERLS